MGKVNSIRSLIGMAAAFRQAGQFEKAQQTEQMSVRMLNPGFDGWWAPYPKKPLNQRQKRKAWRQSPHLRKRQSKRA